MKKGAFLVLGLFFISIILAGFVSADGWVTIFDINNANQEICNRFTNSWYNNDDKFFERLNPNINSPDLSCSGGVVQATSGCIEGVKFCSTKGGYPVFQVRPEQIRLNPNTRFTLWAKWADPTVCAAAITVMDTDFSTAFLAISGWQGFTNLLFDEHASTTGACPHQPECFQVLDFSIDRSPSFDLAPNNWYNLQFTRDGTSYTVNMNGQVISDNKSIAQNKPPNQKMVLFLPQNPGVIDQLEQDSSWCSGGFTSLQVSQIKYECYNTTEIHDGWDNDCDGEVDEGVTAELCDGIDNNGNSLIDENCYSCQNGDYFTVESRRYCFDFRAAGGTQTGARANCESQGFSLASYIDGETALDVVSIIAKYKTDIIDNNKQPYTNINGGNSRALYTDDVCNEFKAKFPNSPELYFDGNTVGQLRCDTGGGVLPMVHNADSIEVSSTYYGRLNDGAAAGAVCELSCIASQEICNGEDDDCDNQIDEGNVCSSISKPYWSSLEDISIQISTTGVNDTVLMVVPGYNLSGTNLNYTIYQAASPLWWNPFTWFSRDFPVISGASDLIYWRANEAGNYYFTVRIPNTNVYNQSDNLLVSLSGSNDPFNNDPPTAIINSPANNYLQGVNCSVNFSQKSTDSDDLLKITWDFGETVYNNSYLAYSANNWSYLGDNLWVWSFGNGFGYPIKIFNDYFAGNRSWIYDSASLGYAAGWYYNNYYDWFWTNMTGWIWPANSIAANTRYTYTTSGIHVIKLTASEMARTQSSTSSRDIVIVGPGINTIPVITSPENGSSDDEWVSFNASQSYVLNCSFNMPDADLTFCGGLGCKYLHRPGKVAISNSEHYDLMMNWTVRDSLGGVQMTKNGWWSTNYSGTQGVVVFDGHFSQVGMHYAKLNMTYYPK